MELRDELIIPKEKVQELIHPTPEVQWDLLTEAIGVLEYSDRLTEGEKYSAIVKLAGSINYPKIEEELKPIIPFKPPESDKEPRPILVKIVVKPNDNHIYYEPKNIVSKSVKRNQQIVYWCQFPFTIYFGGNSIIADSPFAPAISIKAWLQSEPKNEKWHMIDKAWIWMNALSGKYKYFVAVAVPPDAYKDGTHTKVIVDDPEDVVRDPDEDV